jgi:hypothetical protein
MNQPAAVYPRSRSHLRLHGDLPVRHHTRWHWKSMIADEIVRYRELLQLFNALSPD